MNKKWNHYKEPNVNWIYTIIGTTNENSTHATLAIYCNSFFKSYALADGKTKLKVVVANKIIHVPVSNIMI